jgi:hypothetical protein
MRETMRTGTPYVKLRTAAPHTSVFLGVRVRKQCAQPLTNLEGRRGPGQNEKRKLREVGSWQGATTSSENVIRATVWEP